MFALLLMFWMKTMKPWIEQNVSVNIVRHDRSHRRVTSRCRPFRFPISMQIFLHAPQLVAGRTKETFLEGKLIARPV